MKRYILLLLAFICLSSTAQPDVKVYYEEAEDGYEIYADNMEYCPISIQLNFQVSNLKIESGNNEIYIAKANEKKQLLTKLSVIKKGKAYKFSYESMSNLGNTEQKEYDKDFPYHLPYGKSETYELFQGYHGKITHQNINALDFRMPIGTEIRAIREGVVIKVIDKFNKTCTEPSCEKYNNTIVIYQPDGTFAEYAHIRKNGSKVKVGDKVSQDEIIAYSGNVGRSSGPHLHLVVYLQRMNGSQTLKTKFLVDKGEEAIYLEEKESYERAY